MCLLCNKSLSVRKEYNLKIYFIPKYVEYKQIERQQRKDETEEQLREPAANVQQT